MMRMPGHYLTKLGGVSRGISIEGFKSETRGVLPKPSDISVSNPITTVPLPALPQHLRVVRVDLESYQYCGSEDYQG